MRKRDEPAFPVTLPVSQTGAGLTKLEYTAIQMHAAMLSNHELGCNATPYIVEQVMCEANALWDELEKEK